MPDRVRLFAADRNSSSEEAEEILREAGIDYDCVPASSTGDYARLESDLGITSLPAAITSEGIIQGLDAIRHYAANRARAMG